MGFSQADAGPLPCQISSLPEEGLALGCGAQGQEIWDMSRHAVWHAVHFFWTLRRAEMVLTCLGDFLGLESDPGKRPHGVGKLGAAEGRRERL